MEDRKANIKSNDALFRLNLELAKKETEALLEYLSRTPIPPIDWQHLHIGKGCYIEQPNPELNPQVNF